MSEPYPSDYNEAQRLAQLQHDAAGIRQKERHPQELAALRGGPALPAPPRSDYWTFATHAVQGYQQQRAELVKKLIDLSDGFVGNIDARSRSVIDAIAVIDEQIAKLWSRSQ